MPQLIQCQEPDSDLDGPRQPMQLIFFQNGRNSGCLASMVLMATVDSMLDYLSGTRSR